MRVDRLEREMAGGEIGETVGVVEKRPLRLEDAGALVQCLRLAHGRGDGAVELLGAVFHAIEAEPGGKGESERKQGRKTDHGSKASGTAGISAAMRSRTRSRALRARGLAAHSAASGRIA